MTQAHSTSIKVKSVEAPIDVVAVKRVRTAVEKQHGGQVPQDSYIHRMEKVVQRRTEPPTLAKPRPESKLRPSAPPLAQDIHRSLQLNPNNSAFWRSRGESGRPADWQQRWRDINKA